MAYVIGDIAGKLDSPLYGMFGMRGGALAGAACRKAAALGEYFIRQPTDPFREYAIKWDGEWQVTYETFRDMGIAYAVGLLLIYLLVVAQFGSYLTPLDHHGADPAHDHRRDAGTCTARRAVHRDVDDRHDRAGGHHRAQFDPAGRFHQPAGGARRAVRDTP